MQKLINGSQNLTFKLSTVLYSIKRTIKAVALNCLQNYFNLKIYKKHSTVLITKGIQE